MMSPAPDRRRTLAWRVGLAVGCIVLANAVFAERRAMIQAVVGVHGATDDPVVDLPRADARPTTATPPPALNANPVRVILVDGVSAAVADQMPTYAAACQRGLRLTVDVGFPTVSLPVQAALWSGRTQQQSGIQFHSGKPLVPPLDARALPAQVPDSIAVAEAYPYIVQSLGFATVLPRELKPPAEWPRQWQAHARTAMTGPARLAFAHLLAPDTAGHKHGAQSPTYVAAQVDSDRVLADLIAAGSAAHPNARWLVLSDHGHLDQGGHGGEEASIRTVRACAWGPGIAQAQGGPLHLVDLSRLLADWLGVTLPADARGRSIDQALAHPLVGAQAVPGWSRPRMIAAGALLLVGLALTAWAAGRRVWAWPWGWAVALVGMWWVVGWPTMSTPMMYRPRGHDLLLPMILGLTLGAVQLAVALGTARSRRAVVALLALPLTCAAAVFVQAGGLRWWLEGTAPIAPWATASASALLLLSGWTLWVAALAGLVHAGRGWFDPARSAETARTARA